MKFPPRVIVFLALLLTNCTSENVPSQRATCPTGQIEENGNCITPESDLPLCGDGQVEGNEVCDDGNVLTETECPDGQEACTFCNATCTEVISLASDPVPTTPESECGNGVVEEGEVCDDQNTLTETECIYGTPSCTGCSADCSQTLNLVGPYCGDDVLNGVEGCDDGNNITEAACPEGESGCTICSETCTTILLCGSANCDPTTNYCDEGVCQPLPENWTCDEALSQLSQNGTLTTSVAGQSGEMIRQVNPGEKFTVQATGVSSSGCPTCIVQYYVGLYAGETGDGEDPVEGCSAQQSLGDAWSNPTCQTCMSASECMNAGCQSSGANATCFCRSDFSGGMNNGSYQFEFTAPTAPGLYYLKQSSSQHYRCVNTNGGASVGAICVGETETTTNPTEPTEPTEPTGPCGTPPEYDGNELITVQTFDDEVVSWASAHDATFTFPGLEKRFESVTMHLTIECPPGGCDPWDRAGHLTLKHSNGTNYEIARFITPYDIGTSSGGPGTCGWSYDVTSYQHLLRGEQELSLYITTWIGAPRGWQVSISFDFQEGVPELEPFEVVSLWNLGHLVYGNPNNLISDHLTSRQVVIGEEVKAATLRTLVTGHGQGNTDNAAEFSLRWHQITAGNQDYEWTPWRYDCAQNTCSPQGGTWPYGRAGWCPGSGVWPQESDITDQLVPGQTLDLDYTIQPYENCCRPDNPNCDHTNGNCCISFAGECGWNYTGHTEPNFDIDSQLILYRCPQ